MTTKKLKKAKTLAEPGVQDKILQFRELLSEMIVTEPALTAKLCEAIECGRFFITVTFDKKLSPNDKNNLKHSYTYKGIEKEHCLGSIRHIKNDFISKELPNAAIDPDAGWR